MALNIEPAVVKVPANLQSRLHELGRAAFGIQDEVNDNYRVKPVYGFVEPQASTEFKITRTDGHPKEDKFVVQFAAASPKENDPTNAFKSTTPLGEKNCMSARSSSSCCRQRIEFFNF
uniref:MSP domain-containing protein n=1 Tax=Acrobeloides nanus TaxID=290746 RepID=A0A914DZR2_9BILA